MGGKLQATTDQRLRKYFFQTFIHLHHQCAMTGKYINTPDVIIAIETE